MAEIEPARRLNLAQPRRRMRIVAHLLDKEADRCYLAALDATDERSAANWRGKALAYARAAETVRHAREGGSFRPGRGLPRPTALRKARSSILDASASSGPS